MTQHARILSAFVGLSLLASALATTAHAVADFYKGKSINVVVGYGPGGGYDVYMRLLARHMPRFIPGNPSIVVQNMPGAGSVRAANYIAGAAPPLNPCSATRMHNSRR
jgi:tripartite-type tricarboxylate transporter receptor subunit TctC